MLICGACGGGFPVLCVEPKTSAMRYLLFLFSLSIFASCASTSAGINLGADQKFVLGASMTKSYKASLRNRGTQDITVRLIGKASRETVQEIILSPGAYTSVDVDPANEVQLLNNSETEGLIKARMNRSYITGMEYRGINEERSSQKATSWLDTDAGGAKPGDEKRFPYHQLAEIPAGGTFYFAEEMPAGYSAILHNQGSPNINVRIRSRDSGKQTQGFGMGRYSKPIVSLGEQEVLTLVNRGNNTARIKLKLTADISGGRVK